MNFKRNNIKTFLFLNILMVLASLCGNAQIGPLNGKAAEIEREKKFIVHVKQIEEFIDRFNFDSSTMLLQYIDTASKIRYSREELLLHLFDFTEEKLDNEEIAAFQKQVTNDERPEFLDYYGDNWFAVYNCMFEVNGKDREVKFTLKHDCFDDGTCIWAIIAIDGDFLFFPPKNNNDLFINSKSHGTDFLSLRQMLINGNDIYRYLNSPNDICPTDLFSLLIYNSLITYKQHVSLEYYFLQIKNWIIKVEYVNGSEYNSGWLISGLTNALHDDKIKFKKEFLNISPSNEQ